MDGVRGYVIGGSPRTGSSHLCHLLRDTGVLGEPREHVGPDIMGAREVLHLRGPELWEHVLRTSATDNGVFGVKVFGSHLTRLADPWVTATLLGLPVFHLRRRDALGQAISYARALQTHQWVSTHTARAEPVYRTEEVLRALRALQRMEATMQLNYAVHGAEVVHVDYEDHLADPARTVRLVAERMGVDAVAVADVSGGLEVQRDELSVQWRERFLAAMGADPRWLELSGPPPPLTARRLVAGLRRRVRRAAS